MGQAGHDGGEQVDVAGILDTCCGEPLLADVVELLGNGVGLGRRLEAGIVR